MVIGRNKWCILHPDLKWCGFSWLGGCLTLHRLQTPPNSGCVNFKKSKGKYWDLILLKYILCISSSLGVGIRIKQTKRDINQILYIVVAISQTWNWWFDLALLLLESTGISIEQERTKIRLRPPGFLDIWLPLGSGSLDLWNLRGNFWEDRLFKK